MLHSGFLWATFASLVIGTSSSNDFVTNKFPSEFQQNETTKFYWENLDGYIAGIRVYSTGKDSDSDSDKDSDSDSNYNWILEPNCSDSDSDASCTAYANNGSASFGGSLANGTQVALGSGYELVLFWTDSKSYDDIDDDTSKVTSPTFSIVPGKSGDEGSDGGNSEMSKGEKAGIAIAVILVVMFLVLVLWWRLTKERRHRRRNRNKEAERDEEKGDYDRRWTSTMARNLRMGKGMQESWVAAADSPEKPRPTARRSGRDMSKRAGRLYLDDKAELPSDPSPPHRIDTHGLTTAGNRAEPEATRAPVAPVELPTEPLRRQDTAWRPRTAGGTTFAYNPKPSYALRSPASQHAEPIPVSPLSPASASAGAMDRRTLEIDGSVSPLTPISRKPVGGGMRAAPGELR